MDIEKWIDYEFESGTRCTPEYAKFSRNVKKYIKDKTSNEFELVRFNRGHFYFSGFLKNKINEKYVYFCSSDVRFFKNGWYNHLLIRTTKHDRDYYGGSNYYCRITDISDYAIKLTYQSF